MSDSVGMANHIVVFLARDVSKLLNLKAEPPLSKILSGQIRDACRSHFKNTPPPATHRFDTLHSNPIGAPSPRQSDPMTPPLGRVLSFSSTDPNVWSDDVSPGGNLWLCGYFVFLPRLRSDGPSRFTWRRQREDEPP